jgi:hypothetical protein
MEQSAPMSMLLSARRLDPRARTRSPQIPLELASPGVLRWEEVPEAVRERVRDLLAALLRQAAGRPRLAEVGDDE